MNPPLMVTKLTLPVKKWADYCEIRPSSLSKLIKTLHEVKLIDAKYDANLLTIDIPNLLKYADEYGKRMIKKSRQTRDIVPSDSGVKNQINQQNQKILGERPVDELVAHPSPSPKSTGKCSTPNSPKSQPSDEQDDGTAHNASTTSRTH